MASQRYRYCRLLQGSKLKKLLILFGLLVMFSDLADCSLLGRGGVADSARLVEAASILPLPCFQHLKVLSSADGDLEFDQTAIILPVPDLFPELLGPGELLPAPGEVPRIIKVNPFLYVSGSGGIPL